MNFFTLAGRNLVRRPLRTTLAGGGLAVAVASLAALSSFGTGYQSLLHRALDQTGLQLMLVPLGCPYEAAARILDAQAPEGTLPAAALAEVARDPAVAVAAPLLLHATPHRADGRIDLWIGLDRASLALKPWWKAREGADWFSDAPLSVILGAEAAETELRRPGDLLHCEAAGLNLRVDGILARSGTPDDSVFFLPLATAQSMFHLEGRITAIGMRLRDPMDLTEVARRLQAIPGAQVVTATEMMGTVQNLLGTVRVLLIAVAVVAAVGAGLGVLNTMLAAVLERNRELALLRSIGASRLQIGCLLLLETAVLALIAAVTGVALAVVGGPQLENLLRQAVPLAPAGTLGAVTVSLALRCVFIGLAIALLAAIHPLIVAGRLQPADAAKAT